MLKLLLLLGALSPTAFGKTAERDIGVGGGIFTVYPPMVTVDGSWRLSKWAVFGADAGYLTVPVQQFEGSTTYLGLEGKYFFTGGNWFGGLGLGRRTFDITTYNNLTVGETVTEVAWRRQVTQQVLYPKAGWMSWSKNGDSLTLAGGLVIPFGTSFSMTHDPDKIEGGLTQEELDAEEEARADDVKQVTNRVWPSLEIKYAHFFDWLK